MQSQELAHEPDALNIPKLPALDPARLSRWSCNGTFLAPEDGLRRQRHPRRRRRHGGLRRHLRVPLLGRDLKIVCVEKANIERSGAVAQGLYAINCYMGMQME